MERTNPNAVHALYDFESNFGLQAASNPPPIPPVKPYKDDTILQFESLNGIQEIDLTKTGQAGLTPKGVKFDQDKPDWSLLPLNLLTGIVKVLTFGARKYARDNWMKVPDAKNRYTAALLRHFSAWQGGEKIDPETSLSHLYHIGCCLLFLIWFEEKEVGSTN